MRETCNSYSKTKKEVTNLDLINPDVLGVKQLKFLSEGEKSIYCRFKGNVKKTFIWSFIINLYFKVVLNLLCAFSYGLFIQGK